MSPGFSNTDLDLISTFKDYGAELIELAVVDPARISITSLNSALAEAGLERPVICGVFGPERDLRGNPEQVKTSSDYITALIELAVQLGSGLVCGPMYSHTGRTEAYTTAEREIQARQITTALKPLCNMAESTGVTLAIEPLNRFETDCINTLAQAADLIEQVDSPALRILADTFHMHIEENNSAAAILKHGNLIAHVHASASHRGLPGQDQVDWRGVLRALEQTGYTGDMVIESFSEDNQVIARAVSAWRTLYDSPQQLAVEGLAFLRKNWNLIHDVRTAVI
ncbi:MAG: sugar phosphate isomerase/epimerase family protein [Verrucomicrobiota bacterium]